MGDIGAFMQGHGSSAAPDLDGKGRLHSNTAILSKPQSSRTIYKTWPLSICAIFY